ncbi:MAG: hypothetical protein C5B50_01640 [Verrucomicrobia bacterium]|nr:MAG: hypothetical protein C5B50_01640 [Verrucomicrobiota bacterium]
MGKCTICRLEIGDTAGWKLALLFHGGARRSRRFTVTEQTGAVIFLGVPRHRTLKRPKGRAPAVAELFAAWAVQA